MAQLVEQSSAPHENSSSNPGIGKFYLLFTYCIKFFKDENKQKEARNCQLKTIKMCTAGVVSVLAI